MITESINSISFYKEVAETKNFWTVQRDGGVPTLQNNDGVNTFYVWSSRERVVKIIENEEPFQDCIPLEIPWANFAPKWLAELASQGITFSLNWTGSNNMVWEESADEIRTNMEKYLSRIK